MSVGIRFLLCAFVGCALSSCGLVRTATGLISAPLRLLQMGENQPKQRDVLIEQRGQQVATTGPYGSKSDDWSARTHTAARYNGPTDVSGIQ